MPLFLCSMICRQDIRHRGPAGVGKTTLARCLAFRFNVSLIETDLFSIRRQSTMVYRNDWIDRSLESAHSGI